MRRLRRTRGSTAAIIGALAIWLGAALAVGSAASLDQQPGTAATPNRPAVSTPEGVPTPPANQDPAPAAGFAGDAVCLDCHEDQTKTYAGTAHARAKNPRTPAAGQGCESCHGPGKAHADSGGESPMKNPVKMQPRDVSEMCTTCHNRSAHADWAGGKHDSRNISCSTCHSVHQPKSEIAMLKTETQTETCSQCHKAQVTKLHRSSHMPVREGKMECSTCHNPHGSQNVKMLREGNSINESCASCHAEKRGPYLWEHAPGTENCVSCHDPHGSNNERMLVAKVPMLCQRCHVHSRHPPTIYDGTQVANRSNRVVGRACLNCHSQIHGSNHPTSGKAFIR